MSRRTKLTIGLILILLVLISAWLVMRYFGKRAASPSQNQSVSGGSSSSAAVSTPETPRVPFGKVTEDLPQQDRGAVGPDTFVRSFAERYGSFSNQSNFENLEDLYPLMTERMKKEVEASVAQERVKNSPAAPYLGVTTKAVSVKTVLHSSISVTLRVSTQRREVKAGATPRVYYQDLELTLQNSGGQWKIDRAKWQ